MAGLFVAYDPPPVPLLPLAVPSPPDVPVPLMLTVWDVGLELSVTVKVAVSSPEIDGGKVTLIKQLAARASELPQLVLAIAKSKGSGPEMAIPVMVKAEPPLFVRFTL